MLRLLYLLSVTLVSISLSTSANTATSTATSNAPSNAPSNANDTRPNILLLVAEDMSQHIGAFGDPVAVTPTLDELSTQGTNFRNVFTTSGVCAPSRAALITGVHQVKLNAQHMRTKSAIPGLFASGAPVPYDAVPPAEVKAFPELLRAAGYYTYNVTKTDYQFGNPFTIWDNNSSSAHWRDRPDDGKPFFGMVNFMSTHESGLFPQSGFPQSLMHFVTQIILTIRLWGFDDVVTPDQVEVPPYYPDTPAVRETLARLQNNIAYMDGEVKTLLTQLEEDGLADNTIVIFTTDHGDGLPRGKRSLYDLGIRVPIIVRWPEHLRPADEPAGTWRDDLVSFVDFAPTLLKLAGSTVRDWMDGRVFLGPQTDPAPQYVYSAIDRVDVGQQRTRAVTDGRYKLIVDFKTDEPPLHRIEFRDHLPMMADIYAQRDKGGLPQDGGLYDMTRPGRELYDNTADPHEVNNLWDDPAQQARAATMEAALQGWLVAMNDHGEPEFDMIKRIWPGLVQPETAAPQITKTGDGNLHLTSATKGASIGWRVKDGDWQLYQGPIPAQSRGEAKLEAKAIRYGYKESAVTTFSE